MTDKELDSPAFPCGVIAKTYFTDTFKILDASRNEIMIDEKNIA